MKEAQEQFDFNFKIIFLGDSGVGKSNILSRELKGDAYEFTGNHQTTVGVEFANKVIQTTKGTRIKFQIWDTVGQ